MFMGWSTAHVPLGFTPSPFYDLIHLTITRSLAWGLGGGKGGGIFLDAIGIPVNIDNVTFTETQATANSIVLTSEGTGGAVVSEHTHWDAIMIASLRSACCLSVSLCLCAFVQQIATCAAVSIAASRFIGVSADSGGAIAAEATPFLSIKETAFNGVSARSRGGQSAERMHYVGAQQRIVIAESFIVCCLSRSCHRRHQYHEL